jgi:hypothetical protein
MIIGTKCPECGSVKQLTLNSNAFEAWTEGAHVQDCFPKLSEDDRERLISGYCGACWKKIWGEEEEEE